MIGNSATSGGGLYLTDGASVSAESVDLFTNDARDGGGIYLDLGATLSLTDTHVMANMASQYGGGAYFGDGTGTLVSSDCNWGEDTYDNDPDDIYMSWDAIFNYGEGVSFTCDGTVGACD